MKSTPWKTRPRSQPVLLIHCPDQKGIVISITEFIFKNGGNILYLDQHVDTGHQVFFMRIEWDLQDFVITDGKIGEYFETLVARRFTMNWRLHFSDEVPRMALFVSKQPHCFYDILARYEAGEWQVEIPLIISNHTDMQTAAGRLGIDYVHLPVTAENRAEQERKQLELLQQYRIDFIVLARYMQILGDGFIGTLPGPHHQYPPFLSAGVSRCPALSLRT